MPDPCPAPLPIAAFFAPPPGPVFVQFDRNLAGAAGLDIPNWFIRWGNQSYTVTGVSTAGAFTSLTIGAQIPDPGVDVVSYSPPPFDIVADCGTPVAAFANFPLV